MGDENEERAWMAIYQSTLLLAPAPNALPYAFVSLPQAVLTGNDSATGHMTLTGREARAGSKASQDKEQQSPRSPDRASWLEMCLLLTDGRYQLLEAPQLEIRIASTEFDSWAQHLRERCVVEEVTTYR